MITDADKSIIVDLAKRYSAKRVLLFGSSVSDERESADIDLAVEGVPSKSFFRFYGDLMLALSKPIDLIDLSKSADTGFARLIREDGVMIYG